MNAALRPAVNEQVTYDSPTSSDPSTVFQRQRIEACNRLAAEVRGFLAGAPVDDPQVAAILRDCDTVEEVARMLAAPALKLTAAGIPTNGTAP